MKNRLFRKGLQLFSAVCLLSAVGTISSCTDDYNLDETMPEGLSGGSIYDALKKEGNFSTTIRLIDDLNYADVLSKTGSKTLFVADDAAYAKFFAPGGNPWGVTSYEGLSVSQKKYLLYNAMLDNAYVMEMMSNIQSSGSYGSQGFVSGTNLCLRQRSAAGVTDSIPYVLSTDLPNNLNEPNDDGKGDAQYGLFWKRHKAEKPGIYLVCDNTRPMMTHFLERNLNYQKVTYDDVAFVMGDPTVTKGSSYIYNARVIKQDVTCLNGYYNVLDRVLFVPGNMAEVIRTNENTKLFSRILDRFSAPFYDGDVTIDARNLYPSLDIDSVFVKRYFSTRNQDGRMFATNPDMKNATMNGYPVLNFDPAWNAYATSSSTTPEEDMAAMFVPNDDALKQYFITGGGRVLMDRYAKLENTEANIEVNLDQIPLDIISALVNNLMKSSFNESVPSKYKTIMNDARDPMFSEGTYPNVESYKASIEKTLLASNGVVYVMKGVTAPADYAAVIAPAIYSKNTHIVRDVVRADENFIEGSSYTNAPLKQYFSTYLKAMQSNFSFFVPVDEGLSKYGYVDPASIAQGNRMNYRYWIWNHDDGGNSAVPITAKAVKYNEETGQSGDPSADGVKDNSTFMHRSTDALNVGYGPTKRKLLIELINQHVIVHDINEPNGVLGSQRHYFLSREGAPVYVKKQGDGKGVGMEVMGGWQIQLANDAFEGNNHDCVVVEAYDQTRESNNQYGNGRTYLLDRPMQPAMQTVNRIMMNNADNFSEFRQLAEDFDQAVLDSADFRSIAVSAALESGRIKAESEFTDKDYQNYCALYRVFVKGEVGSSTYNTADQLVRFFNNYRYTVYVPTNEAVKNAIANGLPTWDSIREYIDPENAGMPGSYLEPVFDENGNPTDKYRISPENKKKLQAQVILLVNFLKYHFQNETVFVDNVSSNEQRQSLSIDNNSNVYLNLGVKQSNGAITVADLDGHVRNVVTAGGKYNLLARDANFNASPQSTACRTIESSSYAVVHQIDGVLNFTKVDGGNYANLWKTASNATKFVKKYQIKK